MGRALYFGRRPRSPPHDRPPYVGFGFPCRPSSSPSSPSPKSVSVQTVCIDPAGKRDWGLRSQVTPESIRDPTRHPQSPSSSTPGPDPQGLTDPVSGVYGFLVFLIVYESPSRRLYVFCLSRDLQSLTSCSKDLLRSGVVASFPVLRQRLATGVKRRPEVEEE